jgi:sterol desaturase/sphingolipid hydroxylase (fatty acid hydroxylase superfamily)
MFASKIAIAVSILIASVDGFVVPQTGRSLFAVGHDAHGRIVVGSDDTASVLGSTKTLPTRRREHNALHMSSMGADEFIAVSKSRESPATTVDGEDELLSAKSLSIAFTSPSTSSLEDTTITEVSSSSPTFTPFQHTLRSLPFITTAAYLYDPQPLDDLVAKIWSVVYNWDFTQVPIFEAEVAVFGFFTWIIMFSSMHLFLGEERTKESRFDGELPHKPFEWAEPKNYHLWFNPTASYLGSIWLYLQIHKKPPLPELAPTFGVLAVETLFGIFLYDLCFMPIHYLMHNWKVGSVRRVHGYHHRSGKTLNALETVQHSFIDGFLQVFVNIMVQKISPFGGAKHVMSRLLHNLSVTYLLSESHSGYRDLPWMSHNLFPEIFGGAPRHEAHHHNGRVYYQQYFKYIDDFFGFTENRGKNEHETIRRGVELRKRQNEDEGQTKGSEQLEETTLISSKGTAGVTDGAAIAEHL